MQMFIILWMECAPRAMQWIAAVSPGIRLFPVQYPSEPLDLHRGKEPFPPALPIQFQLRARVRA